MAEYTDTGLLGWPFNEIKPENFYIQKDEATTDKVDEKFSNFLKNLLSKLKEEMQISTVSPTENLITETTSDLVDSGSLENMAIQEEFMTKGVTERSTFIPTSFFQNKTKILGLDKMPILENKVSMSLKEITTPYNDDEYEDDVIASTMISDTTEVVINTSNHNGVFIHAMEDSQVNNCYILLILVVVILIFLSVTAGVFLFYKKIKGSKDSGYQVSKIKENNKVKNANENEDNMVNI